MAAKSSQPRWLNEREMRAWRSYIIASRRLLEALESDLDGHDLSMADYEVMAQLSEAPNRRMRMSELAELAMISKSRLSHRMKVMVQPVVVEVVVHGHKQRVVMVAQTLVGAAVVDHIIMLQI